MTKCCNPTSLNLRSELIDLYYDFITNYQNKVKYEKKVSRLENHLKYLNIQLKKKLGLRNATKTQNLKIDLVVIKREYGLYIKEYGKPSDGIWDAQKMACIIDKYKIKTTDKDSSDQIIEKEIIFTDDENTEEPTLEDVTELVAEYEKIVEEIYGVNIESCYDDDGGNE